MRGEPIKLRHTKRKFILFIVIKPRYYIQSKNDNVFYYSGHTLPGYIYEQKQQQQQKQLEMS